MQKTVPLSAISLIKEYEGCELTAYPDPISGAEPFTIGYGHTEGVVQGQTITQNEADAFLMQDAQTACNEVLSVVSVQLNDNQLAALTDFVFNLGIGNLRSSTLLRLLNDGNYTGASNQFPLWDLADGHVIVGLRNRRLAEQRLFNE
jgi:lysozyme